MNEAAPRASKVASEISVATEPFLGFDANTHDIEREQSRLYWM